MASPKRKNPKSSAVSYYDSATDTYPDVAAATPFPVEVVSGGTAGTQYTEDAAAPANPVGTAVNLVRQDTPTTLVSADGDNVAQRGTNYGAAYAQIVTSTGSFVDTFGGGSQYTEDAAAAANPTGTAVNLIRQDTPSTITSADGDNVAQRGTNYGAGYVQVVTSAGAFVDTFGGGTQYTQGDTDASITGTAMMMEGAADTLLPVQGTVADGLLVNLGANNDVTVASLPLPSGASTAANQSTIIGHVDGIEGLLTTIDADTSTLAAVDYATGADVASLAVVGGGAEATAMRVTIANDSTGVVSVDDNGGSITVDGTITEANSAAIAASLSVLDDWDETNRAAVNIIAGQVGVAGGSGVDGATVQRVTLATDVALPAGTNAIGKLAANSGVDIGDVDITSIAAGTNIIGRVGHDITGIGHGVTTVTTAGTDVALAGSTACKSVIITAQTDNTNIIAVGTSGVDATIATGTGVPLSPGDSICIEIDNLADIFIDSLVNGEGVRYMYFT